ncbi:MAG: flagellar hook-length control protein FliK [Lachnospiraceae bacterium]|nr:flagellar hook-length control protein FliK [Lachnospiraceae bacterium]
MTSKPVNADVGSVLASRAAQPSAWQSKTGGNFSDVLQKQTVLPKLGAQENAAASSPRTKLEKQGGGKVKEEQPVKPTDTEKENVSEEDGVSEQEQEQAAKAAEELAAQLMAQLASQMGISEEEAGNLLEEMDLTPVDLLQPGVLTQVLLAAGGETDHAALLTNEGLYTSLQELNGTLQEGLEQIAEMTGLEVSEIQEQLSRLSGQQPEADVVTEVPAEADEEEDSASVGEKTAAGLEAADSSVDAPETDGGRIMLERSRNESRREEGHQGTEEGTGNFAQNLQTQQTTDVPEAPVPVQSHFSEDTRMIMNQIMDFMKLRLGDGLTQLEMQLHPESLGTLQIQIASRHGVLTAQFTAQNEAVKAALESQMVQLQEHFEEQGVKVEAIEVTVQSHAFERNLEQGNHEQHQAEQNAAAQSRVRRLNLGSLEDVPEEELNEADRLAADMMAQSGNSVDYTV